MPEPRDSAAGQPRPDPNEKLVKVFDSEDESEALVVKGLLESAGIDSDLTSASLVQDTFPGLGGMIILVREEDAQAAVAARSRRPAGPGRQSRRERRDGRERRDRRQRRHGRTRPRRHRRHRAGV